ncbi:MAG TPA: hypothetical protein VK338_00175, partial [Candidatus Nitrosocosmicus sp.]|nr:hypothetical protein [Candidatus Nitrosocosmicus sp.]
KKADVVYGARTRVKIVKNKVAPPFKEAVFMVTKDGIDKTDAMLEAAISLEVLSRSGSFIKYNDNVLGQGREQVKDLLERDEKLKKEISDVVYAKAFPKKIKKEEK